MVAVIRLDHTYLPDLHFAKLLNDIHNVLVAVLSIDREVIAVRIGSLAFGVIAVFGNIALKRSSISRLGKLGDVVGLRAYLFKLLIGIRRSAVVAGIRVGGISGNTVFAVIGYGAVLVVVDYRTVLVGKRFAGFIKMTLSVYFIVNRILCLGIKIYYSAVGVGFINIIVICEKHLFEPHIIVAVILILQLVRDT